MMSRTIMEDDMFYGASMFKAFFISALIALCSTGAIASDNGGRIFVLRPPVPGKQPGVLPETAFERVKQGSGGTTDTPSDSGEYTFKSSNWDLWKSEPVTSITVSLSGPDISKRIVVVTPSSMRNAVCRIMDQGGKPYVYAGTYFQNWGGNVGHFEFEPKLPGTFAAVVDCSIYPDPGEGGSIQTYVERLLITATP